MPQFTGAAAHSVRVAGPIILERNLGPIGEFWALLAQKIAGFGGSELAPWQAKLLLQHIFTMGAIPGGAPGEKSPSEKLMKGLSGKGTGGFSYKEIIGKLAQVAGGQDTGAPAGWKGITSIMYARQKVGIFSNPFGSPAGFARAVMANAPYGLAPGGTIPFAKRASSIGKKMDEWGIANLAGLDAAGPIIPNTMLQNTMESRREFERERRSQRGTSGAETLLMGLVPKLLPQAVGGTLFAGGAEIAKAAGPEHSFLYGLGDVTQSVGAEMFRGGAGYYPRYSGMGLDPKRYDPTNIQRWEGPRTRAGRAITGMGQGFRELTGEELPMPFYDPEEEERRKRLEELMIPYQWDEEPWRFRSSPYWGQSYWGQR